MSRFNSAVAENNKVENLAGGPAYKQSPELELASVLVTSFVQDQFYRSTKDTLKRFTELLDEVDPKFAAKAAIYGRDKFNMRSISHVAAAELAKRVKGKQWTKHFFDKVVVRPDDMTEILAYYYKEAGRRHQPHALRKGFGMALARFDEYQLAKYKKADKEVSLVDVANAVHPPHTEAIEKLINGTLPVPKTYETELSASGKSEDKVGAKKEAWSGLIKSRKIGYMALLKNLRNILKDAPEVLDDALKLLTDEKLIRNSRVLPFRFYTAYREIEKVSFDGQRKVLKALSKALDISCRNVPRFNGKTLVVVDGSGSMGSYWSTDSDSKVPINIASLFGGIMAKASDADVMIFEESAWYHGYNPDDSTMTIIDGIRENTHGGGTHLSAAFQAMKKAYDRIVILSDFQTWQERYYGEKPASASLAAYKKRTGADPLVYTFDLQGYGSMQFPERNVFALAGFSDKVFNVMELLETDKQAMVNEIKRIEL